MCTEIAVKAGPPSIVFTHVYSHIFTLGTMQAGYLNSSHRLDKLSSRKVSPLVFFSHRPLPQMRVLITVMET